MELGSLGSFQSHMQKLWGVLAGSFVTLIIEVKYQTRARGVSHGSCRNVCERRRATSQRVDGETV